MIGQAATGRLMAMGTLFMAGPIYSRLTASLDENDRITVGNHMQYLMPMVQRDGAGVMHLTAIWIGPAADSFMHLHRPACKPGQALDITFSRLFCHKNELHGIVQTCSLAPDRWPARRADVPQSQPTEATQP